MIDPTSDSQFDLRVLYEDSELLILNKRSGVPSAPHSPDETGTAVEAALHLCPSLIGVGEKNLEPGLVHRLDTGTSGVLVFAKTQAEFQRLKQIWKDRRVEKIYRAMTMRDSPLPSLPAQIDYPLAHDAKSKKKMIALLNPKWRHYRGKPIPALTRILNGFKLGSSELFDLTVQIETGVMHQIRCHLDAWGAPIWGDPIYGKTKPNPIKAPAERLWLHAWKLGFHAAAGHWLEVEAPLPENWPSSRDPHSLGR